MSGVEQVDVIVIGAGSGGLAAALRAARHGARVAMFEAGALGGTCVNVGCVPKKVMWHTAELAGQLQQAAAVGFDVPAKAALDWPTLLARRSHYIAAIHASYQRSLADSGVELIGQRAHLVAADTVEAADGRRLRAKHIVLATGARPHVPDIPGRELGKVSDDFFQLTHAPQRVAILGGGYIAVELSGVLQALGSHVSVLVRGQRLLEPFDEQIAERAAAHLQAHGVEVRLRCPVSGLRRKGEAGIVVDGDDSGNVYDAVFFATGRRPNTQGLGLEAVGVETDDGGAVVVDAQQRTGVPGLYAVGDITAQPALTPVAVSTARRLMDHLIGGQSYRALDEEQVPSVVFAHPPLGMVGLTERAARERFEQVEVFTSEFRPMLAAITGATTRSLFKVVCAGAEQRVVGIHLIGHGSDEILQGFALALSLGVTRAQLLDAVPIHPTSAEEVLFAR